MSRGGRVDCLLHPRSLAALAWATSRTSGRLARSRHAGRKSYYHDRKHTHDKERPIDAVAEQIYLDRTHGVEVTCDLVFRSRLASTAEGYPRLLLPRETLAASRAPDVPRLAVIARELDVFDGELGEDALDVRASGRRTMGSVS